MTHSHQLDGVRVQGSLVGRTCLQQIVVQRQVCGQFRCGCHGLVGNNLVAGAVVADADDTTVLHGLLSQVAHALARTFTIEILSFELRQHHTNLFHGCDGRHLLAVVVHIFGHVHGDVSTVTLSPSFLPEIASHLSYLVNNRFQFSAAVQNTIKLFLHIFLLLFVPMIYHGC